MHTLLAVARKEAGYTQSELARKMHMSYRSYQNLEYGDQRVTPEQAVKLSQLLGAPGLTQVYCRRECAIGQNYCYEVLNNVDLSPMAILAKYRQEEQEAHEALENMSLLMINKATGADCSKEELAELHRWALELLDLEHVIETLKLRLWNFLDVGKLIAEHNRKCSEKKYFCKDKPDIVKAG